MGVANRESDILQACLSYLNLRGVFCWRSNNTGIYDPASKRYRAFRGLKGVADILGVLPRPAGGSRLGVFLAVEVKRPGGKASAEQKWFLGEVARLGGVALCVRSVEELQADLEPLLETGTHAM